MKSLELIQTLTASTHDIINRVQKLKDLSLDELNARPSQESWSILECLEHLNLYGDFYIPEISKRMENSLKDSDTIFKSGLLGNYFANSMKPKLKLNKMKTFKDKNPAGSRLDESVIDRFLDQQDQMLALLGQAKSKNLTKVKTAITISTLIKLRLGDTFRVIVYHNERHLIQAERNK